jgi:hypothetical protein
MDAKDWGLFLGIMVTLALGIANLIYNLRTSKRTAFVNVVTSERIKWIEKVRDSVAMLFALSEKWMFNRPADYADLQREIEQLKLKIRLQLNPKDAEDKEIEHLLERLPNWRQSMSADDFYALKDSLAVATQAMLKREWDKVKDEAMRGDLRKKC